MYKKKYILVVDIQPKEYVAAIVNQVALTEVYYYIYRTKLFTISTNMEIKLCKTTIIIFFFK